MSTFKVQYKSYDDIIENLKNKCDKAEKDKIVSETNIKMYQEQYDNLVKECESYANTTIDKVQSLLDSKEKELADIMNELSKININDGNITDKEIEDLQKIIDKYQIT